MEEAFREMHEVLLKELLRRVYAQDPYEFEHTVARLLKAMGYGDSWGKSVGVTKKSGDEGVDGFVREDRLGFDMVYYQAKRWNPDKTVGSPEVNAFVGALLGKGASKGVFVTTGKFSQKAIDYVEGFKQQRVVLVDGRQLADLMIDHNVGVSTVQTYEIKSIDSDFFGSDFVACEVIRRPRGGLVLRNLMMGRIAANRVPIRVNGSSVSATGHEVGTRRRMVLPPVDTDSPRGSDA